MSIYSYRYILTPLIIFATLFICVTTLARCRSEKRARILNLPCGAAKHHRSPSCCFEIRFCQLASTCVNFCQLVSTWSSSVKLVKIGQVGQFLSRPVQFCQHASNSVAMRQIRSGQVSGRTSRLEWWSRPNTAWQAALEQQVELIKHDANPA